MAKIEELRTTLAQVQAGQLRPDVLCARFRIASLDWPGLPDRYATVLERLLQPLDVSAMTGEESCSYSRHEVLQGLSDWLDHAAQLPQ